MAENNQIAAFHSEIVKSSISSNAKKAYLISTPQKIAELKKIAHCNTNAELMSFAERLFEMHASDFAEAYKASE